MVTPNVEDLASSFESLVEDRDITGAAVISLAGATGGVIAQQVTNRVLPAIGMQARPTDATGLAASGVTKVLVGALHGYLGLEVGGTAGLALVVAGLGAVVIGGGDLISSGLTVFGNGIMTRYVRDDRTGRPNSDEHRFGPPDLRERPDVHREIERSKPGEH